MRSSTDDGTGFDQLLREAVQEPAVLLPKTSLQGKRFVVEHLLGSGGMGVVYRAMDTSRPASSYRCGKPGTAAVLGVC